MWLDHHPNPSSAHSLSCAGDWVGRVSLMILPYLQYISDPSLLLKELHQGPVWLLLPASCESVVGFLPSCS